LGCPAGTGLAWSTNPPIILCMYVSNLFLPIMYIYYCQHCIDIQQSLGYLSKHIDQTLFDCLVILVIQYLMDMTKQDKETLMRLILNWETRLNNPLWIKKQTNFQIGVAVNHLGKLNTELNKRGK
jgi:hypothetical protein